MPVIDTAALLHWPIERLRGCMAVHSQLVELENLSQDRAILVESAGINWRRVETSLARVAASETGDLPRLSSVDLEVLALAIETNEVLFTDDYSLQNICRAQGMEFKPVSNRVSEKQWYWELRCIGCRATKPTTENSPMECEICGSEMRVKRVR